MFRISLLEGMKNINRRKVVTGLTVLLFTLLFILQGYTYSYYAISEIRGSRLEHETLEEYHLYELGCKTVPGIALRLFRDGLELETAEYYEALEASEHITYVGLWSSSIAIENFKGDHKVFLRYADGDDAYYVAVSTITESSNTMYKVQPYSMGNTLLDTRHSLAPFPIWIAFLARISGCHPSFVAHIAVSFTLIFMTYVI